VNLLSHIYLSGNSEGIITGNFIGDYIKGDGYKEYPEEIKKGILLHRNIDTFTDSHPVVKKSRDILVNEFHKYSGIIVDVFYDHYLSKNWNVFSNMPLNHFLKSIYTILNKQSDFIPQRLNKFYSEMKNEHWLESYHSFEGISKVFDRMSKRTRIRINNFKAIKYLQKYYGLFYHDFYTFFPLVIDYVKKEHNIDIPFPEQLNPPIPPDTKE